MRIVYVGCDFCNGTGEFLGRKCKNCNGDGQIAFKVNDDKKMPELDKKLLNEIYSFSNPMSPDTFWDKIFEEKLGERGEDNIYYKYFIHYIFSVVQTTTKNTVFTTDSKKESKCSNGLKEESKV